MSHQQSINQNKIQTNPTGLRTRFVNPRGCGDNQNCFNSLVNQLNDKVAPVLNNFGSGGGLNLCLNTKKEKRGGKGSTWDLFDTSDSLLGNRVFQSGVIFNTPYGMVTLRTDPNSASKGLIEVWNFGDSALEFTPQTPTVGSFSSLSLDNPQGGLFLPLNYTKSGHQQEVACMVNSGNDLAIVNLDPPLHASPSLLGTVTASTSTVAHVEPVYIPSKQMIAWPTGRAASSNGIIFFDVSDPTNPVEHTNFTSSNIDTIHSLRLSHEQEFLYATGDAGVISIDIRNVNNIVESDSVDVGTNDFRTIALSNNGLLLLLVRRIGSTQLGYETIDISESDKSILTSNTTGTITGTFDQGTSDFRRGIFSPNDIAHFVSGAAGSSDGEAVVWTFDASDRTNVKIVQQDNVTFDLDTNSEVWWSTNDPVKNPGYWIQNGLLTAGNSSKFEIYYPPDTLDDVCVVEAGVFKSTVTWPHAPFEVESDVRVDSLNVEFLDGRRSEDFVRPADILNLPDSSTDNALVRWDGTGAKKVQDSGVTVDDSDNMSGLSILETNIIDIPDFGSEPSDPSTATSRIWAQQEGGFSQLHWKDDNSLVHQLSRDLIVTVSNQTGAQISQGEVVHIIGSSGTFMKVSKAKADSSATLPTLGFAVQDILDGTFGQVMMLGNLENVDTSAFVDGDVLYTSPNTAGAVTTTVPTGSDIVEQVGVVVKGSSAGAGIIAVRNATPIDESNLDHGNLTGLGDNDHTQYPLISGTPSDNQIAVFTGAQGIEGLADLPGISGGRTLTGGTASGEDLKLQSTANATKGSIILGSAGNSAYDEVNDRLGLGTASPQAVLHLSTDVNAAHIRVEEPGVSQSWNIGLANGEFRIRDEGTSNRPFRIEPNSPNDAFKIDSVIGGVGIRTLSPAAQLHVKQVSATAALPVLLLDQADVSEEMIEFTSTVGTGNAIEAVGSKTLTTTHFIKVTITGVGTRYFPVGTIA